MVSIFSSDANAFAGSQLTLTCSMDLDSTLFHILGDLVVTSVWSDPDGGMLSSDSRITVSPASQQGIGTNFISTVVFNTLQTSDAGTYTCEATVAPRGTTAGTVTNGVGSNTGETPTITSMCGLRYAHLYTLCTHLTIAASCCMFRPWNC